MYLRVRSVGTASALICVAWLSLRAQDNYHEAMQRGRDAWGRGACKEAEGLFQNAMDAANAKVVATKLEEVATRLLLAESAICVGDYDDALEDAKDARAQLSPTSPEYAKAQFLGAEAEKAKALYADADRSYTAALRVPVPAPDLAQFLAGWSDLARLQGDFAKADQRIKQALEAADKPASRDSLQRAFTDVAAADLERERGHFSEALRLYTEAVKIVERKAPEHPLAGKASVGIGLIDLADDKIEEAKRLIPRVAEASKRIPNSDAYLRAVDARGMLELTTLNLSAARDDFNANLETVTINRGEPHPGRAAIMDRLGQVDLAEKPPQLNQAIAQFKRAEDIQRRALGDQHPALAITLQYLGRAYRMKGTPVESQKEFDEARRIQIAKLDNDSPALAATYLEEATLSADRDRPAEAEPLYRAALLGPHEMRQYADAVRGLALVLHAENKNPEAGNTIAEWMGLRGQKLPVADPERLPVAMAAAEICLADKDYSEGESKFQEILAASDKLDDKLRSKAETGLANALFGQQKCQTAENLYASVLPSLPDQPKAQAWERLAACYSGKNEAAKSMAAWKKALKVANNPGFPPAELQRIRLTIIEASLETGPDEAVLGDWLTARAKGGSLTPDETAILGKTAEKLEAGNRNAMAEKALKMLLDNAAPGAIPIKTQIDFAEVSARQNMFAQAAEVYEALAMRSQMVGRLPKAEEYLGQAVKLREEDKKPKELAVTMDALGDIYLQQKKYSDAGALFKKAGDTLQRAGLGDSPTYAGSLNGLGKVAQAQRKFEDAESLFEKASGLLNGPDAPRTILASVLFNLGYLKQRDDKMDEANALFERCLQLSRGPFTPENPPPVDEFDQIALFYAQKQWYDKAEERYDKDRDLRLNFFGEQARESGWGWYNLAVFYEGRKAYDKAAANAKKALQIFETSAGPKSDEVSMALGVLYGVYNAQGNDGPAIEAAQRRLAIQTEQGSPRDERQQTLSSLGEMLRGHKDYQQALQVYQRMADLWKTEGYSDPNYQSASRNIVVAYVYLKDLTNAKKSFTQLSKALQKDPVQQQTAARAYADALQKNGQPKDAKRVLSQAGIPDTTKSP
jgi:tetratricopeptide repeat protein